MKGVIAFFIAIVLGFSAVLAYDAVVDDGEFMARLERMF